MFRRIVEFADHDDTSSMASEIVKLFSCIEQRYDEVASALLEEAA